VINLIPENNEEKKIKNIIRDIHISKKEKEKIYNVNQRKIWENYLIYTWSKWVEKKFNNLICKIKRKINQLLIELIFLIDFIFFDS